MKIAIDISQAIYGTGVAIYTYELIRHLAKIDKKNKYILFGSSFRGLPRLRKIAGEFKEISNFEFKLIPLPTGILEFVWNRFSFYPVDKIIGNVDVFHSSDWIQPSVRSKACAKVTTVHDMTPFLFESSQHPKVVSVTKRRMERVKRQVDLVIADSEATKEDVIKFLEIDKDKIRVIYLAASGDFKPQDDQKIRETLAKYKIKKPYILSVGTQEPRKNIQKLIDVYEDVKDKYEGLSLVLTGKYGWGEKVQISQNIVTTGYVEREDLICLYAGCRVFAYPSLYEGFGLPILEAMACGAPVIASNNSSMAEIAKDAAILVDPRSEGQIQKAIEFVLDLNLEDYQKLVRASLERAHKYTWLKTAKETLDVYEQAAKIVNG